VVPRTGALVPRAELARPRDRLRVLRPDDGVDAPPGSPAHLLPNRGARYRRRDPAPGGYAPGRTGPVPAGLSLRHPLAARRTGGGFALDRPRPGAAPSGRARRSAAHARAAEPAPAAPPRVREPPLDRHRDTDLPQPAGRRAAGHAHPPARQLSARVPALLGQ